MKKNPRIPIPPCDPVGVERLLLAERDAVLRRDWRAATEAAQARANLKESFYSPDRRRPV